MLLSYINKNYFSQIVFSFQQARDTIFLVFIKRFIKQHNKIFLSFINFL